MPVYEQFAPLVGNGPNHLASLYFPPTIALILPHCPRYQRSVDILPRRMHSGWRVAPIATPPVVQQNQGVRTSSHPRRRRPIAGQRDQLIAIIYTEKAATNHAPSESTKP